MKKFKQTILHIGTEKTGTTSIQEFMALNRGKLEEDGFLYPRSLGEDNHIRIGAYCTQKEDDDIRKHVLHHFKKSPEEFREHLRMIFLEETEKTSAQTLVVSNEHLHSRLISDEEKVTLRSFFQPVSEKIKIVIYLRRQDKLMCSLISTAFKAGHDNLDRIFMDKPGPTGIFPPTSENRPYYFDYQKIIESYGRVFGMENIVVRLMESDCLVNRDVVEDFFVQIGGKDFGAYAQIERKNETLSPSALRFLSVFNKHVPVFVNNAPNPLRANIIALLERKYSGNGIVPPRAEAVEFYNRFKDSNAWIKERFFSQRTTLFSEDFSSYPEEKNIPEAPVADIIQIASFLWNEKQSVINAIRNSSSN